MLNNLAAVSFDLGHFDDAERWYEESQQIIIETLGAEHWLNFHFALRLARIAMRPPRVSSGAKRNWERFTSGGRISMSMR